MDLAAELADRVRMRDEIILDLVEQVLADIERLSREETPAQRARAVVATWPSQVTRDQVYDRDRAALLTVAVTLRKNLKK